MTTVIRNCFPSGFTEKVCVILPGPETADLGHELSSIPFRLALDVGIVVLDFLPSGESRVVQAVGAGQHDHRLGLGDDEVIRRIGDVAHRVAHAHHVLGIPAAGAGVAAARQPPPPPKPPPPESAAAPSAAATSATAAAAAAGAARATVVAPLPRAPPARRSGLCCASTHRRSTRPVPLIFPGPRAARADRRRPPPELPSRTGFA